MMRIMLNQSEIEQALRQYAASQGIDVQGKRVEITLTAGRGANGFYAELNIEPKAEADKPHVAFQDFATVENPLASAIPALYHEDDTVPVEKVAELVIPVQETVQEKPEAIPRSLFDV